MAEPEPRMQSVIAEIKSATAEVEKAMISYREGKASCSEVNKANDALASAHLRLREVSGGRIRDFRY
jgi:hypothetical protein